MIKIKINNSEFLVKNDISILEACKYVGISVPRFCYHETLSVAGSCRMCLVEVANIPKPVSSCTQPIMNGMQIYVDTPLVKKARENVIETLLLNHPLDCPICDQGGECDLQDQTKIWGSDYSRFFFNKRGVEDKNCGPLIKTIMSRCIHCTRCVRFGTEIAGVDYMGTLNRGTSTEVGSYISKIFNSEISGNIIDLCPVGALTSKPYAFKARPWELRSNESIDLTDSTGSNIYVNFKETEVMRVLPKNNHEINENIISDKARFSYDSIKNQRLQKLFAFNNKNSNFETSNWQSILSTLDTLLKTQNKILFLVNEEIDLESAHILNLIESKFFPQVLIKSVEDKKNENCFLSWSNNKISDIKNSGKYCFLFSLNLKMESAILNTKLRRKVISQTFNVISLGQKYNSNFPIKFINLNLNNINNIIEGKNQISKLFLKSKAPLIFLGESLKKRMQGTFSLSNFISKIIPSSLFLNIKKSSNSSGSAFLALNSVSSNDIKKVNTIVAINLEDNVKLRKLLLPTTNTLIWLNSYGSELAKNSNILIPTLSSFEAENIFINLEERPQKTLKTLSGIGDARNVKKILMSFYPEINSKVFDDKWKSLTFFNELLVDPEKFQKLIVKYSKKDLFNSNFIENKNIICKYPLKSSLEDFYRSNSFTKNSFVMAQCSQEVRKNSSNF